MKKLIFIVAFILPFTVFSQSQEPKPPKMEYHSGFWSNYFTLGDKKIHPDEIELHLKKYSPEAYQNLRDSKKYGYTALGFSIAALGSSIWYLVESTKTTPNPKMKGAALASTGIGICFSIPFLFSAENKIQKAKNTYNKQFGY